MITQNEKISRSKACLILGAIGDALGAPVEFMSYEEILNKYGTKGIKGFDHDYGVLGPVTDDTQMTLMAADGLMSAYERGSERGILGEYWTYVAMSYIRWLETQGGKNSNYVTAETWGSQDLFEVIKKQGARAPGTTCMAALSKLSNPPQPADNDSKGCGTVMRVSPIGIFFGNLYGVEGTNINKIYDQASKDAAITHGHAFAQEASGLLAVITALCLNGFSLTEAVSKSLSGFDTSPVIKLIERAVALAKDTPSVENIKSLGEGWVAEEALAISIYCALSGVLHNLTTTGTLLLAVNHGGDSDSTGAITGNLIGISQGYEAIDSVYFDSTTEVGSLIPLLEDYGEKLITVVPTV